MHPLFARIPPRPDVRARGRRMSPDQAARYAESNKHEDFFVRSLVTPKPQRGRWRLSIDGAIHAREPTRLAKAVSSGDLGDARRRGIGISQRRPRQFQSPEPKIPANGYAQELGAARAQGSLRYADRRTEFRNVQGVGVSRQHTLETIHDRSAARS